MKEAAKWGDKDEYERKKEAVRKNDNWTVIYGSGALLAAAVGIYLAIRWEYGNTVQVSQKPKKGSLRVATMDFSQIKINYIYRF